MFSSPPHERAALAWADRLFRETLPVLANDYGFGPVDAMLAYQQVERRYGSSAHVRTRIGDCLLALGRYREAFERYPASAITKRQDALRRQAWAGTSRRLLKGRDVLTVEPVPRRSDRWVAFCAAAGSRSFAPLSIRLMSMNGSIGAEARLDDAETRWEALYVTDLACGQEPVAIVYRDFGGADSDHNAQAIYRITERGFVLLQKFGGVAPTRIAFANQRHGLRLLVTPTWKVWWPDVYEWRGGAFRFANRRSPDLYSLSDWNPRQPELRNHYPTWLKYASVLGIKRRFRAALRALLEAERLCRSAVRLGVKGAGTGFYTAGFHGDDRVNLGEIRQRIRWLRRDEHGHALLYRPYDFDLLVPPYRLGRSREGWEP